MNGSTLQRIAAECAEELPGARLEHPFGPDWEVFKVRGKVFMLMTEVPGRPVSPPDVAGDLPAALEADQQAHPDGDPTVVVDPRLEGRRLGQFRRLRHQIRRRPGKTLSNWEKTWSCGESA